MKRMYFVSIFILMLSQTNYAQRKFDNWWEEVEELELQGKSMSAYEKALKIKKKANRKENNKQFIKAFLYVEKYKLILKDNSQEEVYLDYIKEINLQSTPNKQILFSYLAESLTDYYRQNRYRIRNRTKDSTTTDFLTWDQEAFKEKIIYFYKQSLTQENQLIKHSLKDFTDILNYGDNYGRYNSSLYDLLANRYIDFLKNPPFYNSSKSPYSIKDPKFFGLPEEFININIKNLKDDSNKVSILKAYQNLTRLHIENKDSLSVLITSLERLIFVKDNGSFEEPNELYENALKNFDEAFKHKLEKSWINYKLASFYYTHANKSNRPTYLQKSLDHIQKIKNTTLSSYPGNEALKIEKAIVSPRINIQTQKFLLPNKNFRALVNFKNSDSLHLFIYKAPKRVLNKTFNRDSIVKELYRQNKLVSSQQFGLPPIENHFSYTTEILIDSLAVGHYVMLFSRDKKINLDTDNYQYQFIQVTNISYTNFDLGKDQQLYITSRTTGEPLKNVKIILEDNSSKSYLSNARGLVTLIGKNRFYNSKITLIKDEDTLNNLVRFQQKHTRRSTQSPEINSHLFTDRAIYRPGQSIFFKGILSYRSENEQKIVPNEKVFVELYDANDDVIDSLSLTTNEYGSVQGEFKIPKNVLLGEFEIALDEDFEENSPFYNTNFDYTYKEIKVEEYKRPKFEVEFNPIDSTYILNDSIELRGKATAFFGGNLTGAKVNYTVNRSMNYNPLYRSSNSYIYKPSTRLTTGTTQTDSKGNFIIFFKAIPDSIINPDFRPIFNYEIEATVTDVNGETHTASKSIRIGYHATEINIVSPHSVEINKEQQLKIYAKDFNHLSSKADGKLKIYQYIKPDRILTGRGWKIPEIQQIRKEEFIKNFPYTAYDSLDLEENWPKELVISIPLEIDSIAEINIDDYKDDLKTGEYFLEFTGKGKLGFPVRSEKRILLKNPNDQLEQKGKDFISFSSEIEEIKQGKQVTLHLSTPLDSLPVFLNIAYDSQLQKQENLRIYKGNNSIRFLIPDKIESVHLEYVFNTLGHYKSSKHTIHVPQPKEEEKNLKFEVVTFKNKLEPGSNQTWQLKVLDYQNKAANAEVLASMYDASLDEFVFHDWNNILNQKPYVYRESGLPQSSFGLNSFNTLYFNQENYPYASYYLKTINYTTFKNFGYNFTNAINTNNIYLTQLQLKAQKNKQEKGVAAGVVTDEKGLPLPGVNVIIKGTTKGTQTDFDGRFIIKVNKDDRLVFSSIGFNTKEQEAHHSELISMEVSSERLEEVVITGFDNEDRQLFTGANSTILEKSVDVSMLEGKAAGVNITGTFGASSKITIRGASSISNDKEPLIVIDGEIISENDFKELSQDDITSIKILEGDAATSLYGARALNGVFIITTIKAAEEELQQVETRTDLKETAFFFPQLKTNKKGEVSFEFNSPEALTRWKFQAFAHDKNLHQAKIDLTAITQKDLNIIPNFPRFFRSKDTVIISAKVSNLSKNVLNGIIHLEFTNELSQEKIQLVTDVQPLKNFNIQPKENTEVSWKLIIPKNLSAVRYRIVAKAGNFSDGEESIIPVLSNRIFVTETLPIWLNPHEKKTVTFNNLNNNTSSTLQNHQLVFEYTTNPVWTSLRALPYLIEYPFECAEQTFSRYYGNYLATILLERNPEIQETFHNWQENKTELSDLNKNEELKQILLQETPWIKTAESEEEQQKRLAHLLDLKEAHKRSEETLKQLTQLQLYSGGFPWFSGGRENLSISLHILKGMGRLLRFAPNLEDNDMFDDVSTNLIIYLDNEFLKKNFTREDYKFSTIEINYVYARSFFNGFKDKNFEDYKDQLLDYLSNNWINLSIQSKITLAIIAHKYKKDKLATSILTSLKENAVINSNYGIYWKEVVNSRLWYNAPIATQALAIEAFNEIDQDKETINQLKIWLLRNKKTEAWNSTKATTEAIYALLLQGNYDFNNTNAPKIKIGKQKLNTDTENKLGYFKTSFSAEEISAEMATVEIKNNSDSPQYGGYYWQYFEEADQVEAHSQGTLSIQKELFKKADSEEGSNLVPINKTPLKIGDLITVRLIIKAKENFSFMHLKDMRAAGLEPVDVLSEYKWQDGLGYYQSTKDVATHFFFDQIQKGTYVFEYNLRVNNSGKFSNGITQLQSMYAPEFSVKTEGARIKVQQ